MAAISTQSIPRQESAANLSRSIRSYKNTTIAKAIIAFGASGTGTGNDVVALWAQSVNFYNEAGSIVSGQTSLQLQASWEAATGDDVADLRSDLSDLRVSILDLIGTIETNQSAFLAATLDRSSIRVDYPALTAGQRVAVKAKVDAVDALIT